MRLFGALPWRMETGSLPPRAGCGRLAAGVFWRRGCGRRAGRCILVVRAVRRGRPPMDRSWPL